MTKTCSFRLMASAALIFIAASVPTYAEGPVSDALGGINDTVGGLAGRVDGAVNDASGGNVNSATGATANDSQIELSENARQKIVEDVNADASLLSNRKLTKLCLAVGGGSGGCGSGDRTQILGLIDSRVAGLSDEQLAGLCVSTGTGCGNAVAGSIPPAAGETAANGQRIVANMSGHEIVAYKKRCVNILRSPQNYEDDVVSICRLIKRQKV